jgi:hypothetical protein
MKKLSYSSGVQAWGCASQSPEAQEEEKMPDAAPVSLSCWASAWAAVLMSISR